MDVLTYILVTFKFILTSPKRLLASSKSDLSMSFYKNALTAMQVKQTNSQMVTPSPCDIGILKEVFEEQEMLVLKRNSIS